MKLNVEDILDRIQQRTEELGISERQASIRAGLSSEGIRNWRRRSGGANADSLKKVADALGVSFQWLVEGIEETAPSGMAEDAVPYEPPQSSNAPDPVKLLFGANYRNPAITNRASRDMPGFGIFAGDLIVCDLSSEPGQGDIAVGVRYEPDGRASTIVRQLLPPFLSDCDPLNRTPPLHLERDDVVLRHPVIGIIRGLAPKGI